MKECHRSRKRYRGSVDWMEHRRSSDVTPDEVTVCGRETYVGGSFVVSMVVILLLEDKNSCRCDSDGDWDVLKYSLGMMKVERREELVRESSGKMSTGVQGVTPT